MRKSPFSYDWRMWSIPEIKEILLDANTCGTLESCGRINRDPSFLSSVEAQMLETNSQGAVEIPTGITRR